MAIARIEGRRDDQLMLPDTLGRPQRVFADLCSRAIANALPLTSDYRLIQAGERQLQLIADCSEAELANCQGQLAALFERHGIASAGLEWQLRYAGGDAAV